MAYSQAVLHRARIRLAEEKESYEQERSAERRRIYSEYPRLREIDNLLRTTVAEAMSAAFRTGQDPAETIAAMKKKNLDLQRERTGILTSAGLSEESLDPVPFCPLCGGSGYRGAVMCECLKSRCIQEQEQELAALLNSECSGFESFSLLYYSTQIDPVYGISPRENMQIVFDEVRTYAREFTCDADSLLFAGATGLGKTTLSACMAEEIAGKGYSVVYDTAVNMLSAFEAEKFRAQAEASGDDTAKYVQSDLLIIDDLGTEMSTQFTLSVLYTVVNTRLMSRRPTVISTNLSMEEMKRRYTPQLMSRLEGSYRMLPFLGEDIRLLKRDEV